MNDAPNAAANGSDFDDPSASTVPRDEIEVLRHLVEATVRSTGEGFFNALVRHLAASVDADNAFVAELAGATTGVRTIALWSKDRIVDNVEWDLEGTPCQDVVHGRLCARRFGPSTTSRRSSAARRHYTRCSARRSRWRPPTRPC